MTPTFWRLELRLMLRDRAVVWGALLLAGILVGAWVDTARWQQARRTQVDSLQQAETARLDSVEQAAFAAPHAVGEAQVAARGYRLPASLGSRLGPLTILPVSPAAALAIGQSDLFPDRLKLTTASFHTLQTGVALANPTLLQEGRLDPTFVLVFLFPLYLLAVGHHLVSGERERGTLALLAVHRAHLRRLLLLRLGLRTAPLLVALGALVGAVVWQRGGMAALPGLVPWLLGAIAYLGFWAGAILLVNARGRSSAENAVSLAGLWLAIVVVAPALLNGLATVIHPVPSRLTLAGASRAVTQEVNANVDDAVTRFFLDHPELMAGDTTTNAVTAAIRSRAIQEARDARLDPVHRAFEDEILAQHRLIQVGRILSPAIVFHQLSTETAGTGLGRYLAFRAQQRAFHAEWVRWFSPAILHGGMVDSAFVADRPRWDSQADDGSAGRQWWGVLILLVVGLGTLGLGQRRLAAVVD